MRAYTLDLLRGVVALAGDLEVPGVVIGPGKANPLFPAPKDRLTSYFHQALDVLVPLAEQAGTGLWVENMPFAFLPAADELMQAIDAYGNDDIGVVYDVANGVFIGEDPAVGLERVKARLRLVHLSDTTTKVYRHDPVGQGDVRFAEVPAALRAVGYEELPMLEIIATGDADADIRDSIDKLWAMGWPRSVEAHA
jgi:sugar phosphate isomerase/epimerase